MQDRRMPLRSNRRAVFFIHGFVSDVNDTQYVELIKTWLKKVRNLSIKWTKVCTLSQSTERLAISSTQAGHVLKMSILYYISIISLIPISRYEKQI